MSSSAKDIVDSVMSALGSGQMKVGDELPPIAAIQETYEATRTDVKTAFDRLELLGVIQRTKGKQPVVISAAPVIPNNSLTAADVEMLYDAREEWTNATLALLELDREIALMQARRAKLVVKQFAATMDLNGQVSKAIGRDIASWKQAVNPKVLELFEEYAPEMLENYS